MSTATTYAVKYELADAPVPRWHRTMAAAIRDCRRCQRAQTDDFQGVWLVAREGNDVRALTDAEQDIASARC